MSSVCLSLLLFVSLAQAQYATLESFIQREMADKQLPSLAIALVDDQRVVWRRDFGATPKTVYRVGSVSKLFTDIAIMQLVERGELDLDAPVANYLPDFHPANPFGRPITLRQLMSHLSGLTREPPVGHYFDNTAPTLAATVASLNATELVYAPETHTKYSNAGIAVVGYVLERLRKQPFAKYVKQAVLDPVGMRESSFEPLPAAPAFLWTYDGRTFPAPTFPLGMAPAGSLYATVGDLAKLMSVLFAGGRGMLRSDTLQRMWQPQFGKEGFGLGFALTQFEGHRRVGHGGAIYGFATDLSALPDDKLGAIVVTTKDSANPVVAHIGREALRLMLAARQGKRAPAIAQSTVVPAGEARSLEGRYGSGDKSIELTAPNGHLYMTRAAGGKRVALRKLGGDLIVDDLLGYGQKVTPLPAAVPTGKPAPTPAEWRGLIGEYGWDHNVLYILERDSRLTALIEWYDYYPVTAISATMFRFPGWGLYDGESLIFRVDLSGRAVEARVGGVVFPRRAIGPESGNVFRITPRRPLADIRREALAATPPVEPGTRRKPELVELTSLDRTIKLDIRYAGKDNFLSTPLYSAARAFMQRPAAEALVRAHRKLAQQGYGLLIHDAYRPWSVTKMFWEATPDDKRIFVANPAEGSRHNRGCAVDLTLYERRTGKPVEMVGVYDEMSERSYPDYPGGTALQRWHRALLRHAMEAEDFTVNDVEWWHFDFRDWNEYGIGNVDFAAARAR